MTPFLRLVNVTKQFGSRTACQAVNLDVARAECLAIIGENGCGATTLLLLMAALVEPSSGRVEVDGIDAASNVWAVRRRTAYAGISVLAAGRSTVEQYISLVQDNRRASTRSPMPPVEALLIRAGLEGDMPIDALSTGLARRVSNVAAIATGADLLLLDRPFDGLDERGRETFLSWFRELRSAGTTIAMAAGSEREALSVGTRIITLGRGRMLVERGAGGPEPRGGGVRAAAGVH